MKKRKWETTRQLKPRPDGYTRRTFGGTRKLMHVWVWERHFGPVPYGHHLHHKNGNRNDNRIENLEAVKPLDHARIHAGCYKDKAGKWIKPCNTCGRHLSLEKDFFGKGFSSGLVNYECKRCSIRHGLIRRNKQKIKTARAALKLLLAELKKVKRVKR